MLLLLSHALAFAVVEPASRARIEGSISAILSDDDYPIEAIRKQEQGTVAFRLEISETGKVASCSVTESSGSKLIDETTCRIMSERARFNPARDARGRAVADSFNSRIVWRLPDSPPGTPLQTALRAINNVWEVTADGRQRSCRRERVFEGGEQLNIGECNKLNLKFVAAAATYLRARPEEILTIRLENRWLLDPVLPFPPVPAHRGEILSRGEGDYRLNDDLTVRDCSEGRFSARFDWLPAPCFRKDFADEVPAATGGLRMEVQWVVSRGPDTERPAQMPSLVAADGTMVLPLGNGL
jgi:TonB family protein